MNYSILILGLSFFLFMLLRIITIRFKSFPSYNEIISILMDSATFMAGIIALALALDLDVALMGKDISYTQPFINYIAGIMLVAFSLFRVFKGGNKDVKKR